MSTDPGRSGSGVAPAPAGPVDPLPEPGAGPGRPRRYALLVAPAGNRVYAGEALRLAGAELAAFGETVLGCLPAQVGTVELGGVPYVEFTTDRPLSGRDLAHLANLSCGYALFERDGELLRPVRLNPRAYYDEDLVTVPKAARESNDQLTRLLLNVTVAASARADALQGGRPEPSPGRRLVVLDPLCGRGATLNQALRYGYHAVGVEADGGQVDAYSGFLRTWLRRKRLKHTVDMHPVRHDRQRVARRLTATLAPTKEAYRAGDTQQVTVLHADTTRVRELLRRQPCDVIVTEASYGVAQGGRAAGRAGRGRRPLELLGSALPAWVAVLRSGGALGIAFDPHVTDREELSALLAGAGLAVVSSPGYQGFRHQVGHGFTRDLLVARK